MKKLDTDILGLCEMQWTNNGDFWSDDYRTIHSHSINGRNGVEIILNKKWGSRVTNFVIYNSGLLLI